MMGQIVPYLLLPDAAIRWPTCGRRRAAPTVLFNCHAGLLTREEPLQLRADGLVHQRGEPVFKNRVTRRSGRRGF